MRTYLSSLKKSHIVLRILEIELPASSGTSGVEEKTSVVV